MGPPRDRLQVMQQQAYFGDDDEYAIPVDEEDHGPMREFFKEIEDLRDIVSQVDKDILRVKKIQSDIISSPMVDPKAKQELEDAMNEIKKRANVVRTKLKTMELAIEEQEKMDKTSAEVRMKKTQHMALSKKFVDIMTEYNRIQMEHRDASKSQMKRQMELAGSNNLTDDELETMLEEGGRAKLLGHVQIEGNEDQLRQTINDIQNRHEMFLNLEKSITDLHDMFLDIAMLIENQGEMVNRIDAHVESAVEYTTRATNDTKKALEYQSKARRKKIMMLLCVIVAGSLGTYMGLKHLNIV